MQRTAHQCMHFTTPCKACQLHLATCRFYPYYLIMKSIRLPSIIITAIAAIVLTVPRQMLADTIVDTDQGISGWTGGKSLFNDPDGAYQNLAMEFTLISATNITSVEGWISEANGSNGSLTIGIGTTPGDLLFSGMYQSQTLPEINQWTGLTGLDWYLEAGTYWVSFIANTGFSASMPGSAPLPTSRYAVSQTFNPSWNVYNYDGLETDALGLRVSGDVQSIPDTGVNIFMFGGVLVGLAGLRRRCAH